MKRFDPSAMDDIERELDELEDALRADRQRRRKRDVPAAGGGVIATKTVYADNIRPRPAAFAKAVSDGMTSVQAAVRAGYRGSRMAASRLMRDKRVLDEIERLNLRRGCTGATAADLPDTSDGSAASSRCRG